MHINKKYLLNRSFYALLLLPALSLLSATCVQKGSSQNYAITLQLPVTWSADTLFLCSYYGEKERKIDSLFVGNDKRVTFKGRELLQAGMYVINSAHFPLGVDFFISDGLPQQFEIIYIPSEEMPSLEITGSPENKAFADYMKYSFAKHREKVRMEERWQNQAIPPDSAVAMYRRINDLMQEVKEYNATLEKKYEGSTFALFLKMIQEIEVPVSDISSTAANRDSLLQMYYYNFYKEHYFDNVDFSDGRIVRMPFLDNKLSTYFVRILPPDPDVVNEYVDKVLAKARANRTVYEFVVRDLYNLFRESPIPEMYQVAVHIGDDYVLRESAEWSDKEYVGKMAVAMRAAKLNPVGEKATDLLLQTPDGKNSSIYDVQSPYTLLYFYDPGCESCTVITPEVYRLYQKYKHKGLKVYAVYIEGTKEPWIKYITENKLDWINVYDEHANQNIYDKYDIHAIPMMLLLDKNKIVLAKDFLPDLLEYMLEQL